MKLDFFVLPCLRAPATAFVQSTNGYDFPTERIEIINIEGI